jgi:hypothetical protein
MQKMSLPESIEQIAWDELLCDAPIFDSSQKRLTFDTRRFDRTSDGQFLAEDGFLHFENVAEILIEPNKISLEDLETDIEGNLWAYDYTFLIFHIFAEFLIWQPKTDNQQPITKD